MKALAVVAGVVIVTNVAIGTMRPAVAADLPLRPRGVGAPPEAWQFRFTPYAWLLSVSGTVTARNQTIDFNTGFVDVIQNSDSLIGWMSYFEARREALAFYADVIWGKLKRSGDAAAYRNPVAGLSFSASAGGSATIEFAVVEVGATYEVARWGGGRSFTALDAVGGARYWYSSVDLTFGITGAVDLERLGLERSGNLALADSGGTQWVDPVVGGNLRHQFAPGKEMRLRADIGGFGVGSKSSWQLLAAYSQEFKLSDATLAWSLGYRVLNVSRETGSDTSVRGIDFTLYGPMAGLSFRW